MSVVAFFQLQNPLMTYEHIQSTDETSYKQYSVSQVRTYALYGKELTNAGSAFEDLIFPCLNFVPQVWQNATSFPSS